MAKSEVMQLMVITRAVEIAKHLGQRRSPKKGQVLLRQVELFMIASFVMSAHGSEWLRASAGGLEQNIEVVLGNSDPR